MHAFTLEDFDRWFGPDMDALGSVSFDDAFLTDELSTKAESGQESRIVRGSYMEMQGDADTLESMTVRFAWVPGDGLGTCVMETYGFCTDARAAVYAVEGAATTGSIDLDWYRNRRIPLAVCGMEAGQDFILSFRGWAWKADTRADGIWIRSTQFSQLTDEVVG